MKIKIFQNSVVSEIGPCSIVIEWDTERKEFRSERETPLQNSFGPMSAEDAMVIMSDGLELSVDEVCEQIKSNEVVEQYVSDIKEALAALDRERLKEYWKQCQEG